MKLKLYLDKSLEKNAEVYFEKAKKLKKKLKGAREALERSRDKLDSLLKKEQEEKSFLEEEEQKRTETKTPKTWYQKFHWFVSSEGFLCVGGRDATSNEILIKNHTEKNDLVFHTDIAGSPFFVIKNIDNKDIGKNTIEETAIATASFSRAWRQGIGVADVYCITPEQVSKKAQSGEYLGKGSFMIYGKRSYTAAKLEMAIGITKNNIIMSGPVDAVKKSCTKHVIIIQGRGKKEETAKKVRAKVGGELDDIIAALPSGGCDIKKQ